MSTTKDFNVRYNFAWHAKTHDTLIYVLQSKCEPAAWVCSVSSPLSITCWSVFNWWCWHHACSCCTFKKIMWGIRFLFFCFLVRSGVCIWSPWSKKWGRSQLSVSMLWKSIFHQRMLCFTVAITTGFLERHPAQHLFWALSVIYFISLKVNQISKVLYLSSLYVNTTYTVLITTLIKVCWLHWQLFSKWEIHLVIRKGTFTGATITLIGGLKKPLLDEPWLLLIRLSLAFSPQPPAAQWLASLPLPL